MNVIEEGIMQSLSRIAKSGKELMAREPELHQAIQNVVDYSKSSSKLGDKLMGVKKNKNLRTLEIGQLESVDDVVFALRNTVDKKQLNSLYGQLYSGLLKTSAHLPKDIIDDIARDLVGDKKFINKYAKVPQGELKKMLISKGYSQQGINAILKETKQNKLFLSAQQKVGQTPPTQRKFWNRFGQLVKNPNIKKIKRITVTGAMIKYLVLLGIPSYLIWRGLVNLHKKHIKEDESVEFTHKDGTPYTQEEIDQESAKYLSERQARLRGQSSASSLPCFQTLIDKEVGQVSKNAQGIRYVYVKNTVGQPWGTKDYDAQGGVIFYENGTFTTGNGTQKGRWDCNALQELYNIGLSVLNEQNEDKIVRDIRLFLDKPQSSSRTQYVLNNNFPFQQGQKNDRIREMQVALGFDPKYRTGNFGPITMKALQGSGYDMSKGITPEIYNDVLQKYTAKMQSQTQVQPQPQAQQQTQPQPQAQQQTQMQAQQPQRVQPITNVSNQPKMPSLSSLAPGQIQQRKS